MNELRTRLVVGVAVVALAGGSVLNTVAAGGEPAAASAFVPVTPTRVLDTRIDVGLTGRFAHGEGRLLRVTGEVPAVLAGDVAGSATVVPAGATGLVANVTAVTPSTAGHVSVRPGTAVGEPTTSNINFTTGGVVAPNSVTVALPTNGAAAGRIELYFYGTSSSATTDLLVDVVGYYVPAVGEPGPAGPRGPQGPSGATGPAGPARMLDREVVSQEFSITPGQSFRVGIVRCPEGKVSVGGGGIDLEFQLNLMTSVPEGPAGWRAEFRPKYPGNATGTHRFNTYVVCVADDGG